jgi:hypothetical protein
LDHFKYGANWDRNQAGVSGVTYDVLYAQSNYRGMAASCQTSLSFGYGGPTVNQFTGSPQGLPGGVYCRDTDGNGGKGVDTRTLKHPDGAIFVPKPGMNPLSFKDVVDGLSHTIFCAETIDNFCSPPSFTPPTGFTQNDPGGWVFPPGCELVGMVADRAGGWVGNADFKEPDAFTIGIYPYSNSVPNMMPTDTHFGSGAGSTPYASNGVSWYRFFTPLGYGITSSQAKANTPPLFDITTVRAFTAFDFLHQDAARYSVAMVGGSPLPAVTDNANYHMAACTVWPPVATASPTAMRENPMCGPSAGHPTGVNHLMGDGSVRTLDKNIDVPAYFFLITRANHDPAVTLP